MTQYKLEMEMQTSTRKMKRESNSLLFKNIFFLNLGKLSDASTFCSYNAKESEDTMNKKSFTLLFNLNILRKSKSTLKITKRKSAILFLIIRNKTLKKDENTKIKLEKKKHKSKDKIILINTKDINKAENNIIQTKINNDINKRENNNINNTKFVKMNYLNTGQKIKNEQYTQNCNISCMKKAPPKLPEMLSFRHDINSSSKGIFSNETYMKLSKGKIPNINFGHLLVDCRTKKKKYFNFTITQRNKNKLLTITYYKPY